MKVTFIIPNFNQLHYLRNLIHWIEWHHPDREQYPVFILDNKSSYSPLLEYYNNIETDKKHTLIKFEENDFCGNLRQFIDSDFCSDLFVVADPDVLPHPTTPYNYLDYFIAAIEQGYHHAGFDLITDDLPDSLEKKAHIIYDENLCRVEKININGVEGYRSAIDTTFCLYRKSNGGWYAPMNGKDWTNAARLFKAFHFKWYIDPNHINPELDNYFKTANFRDFGNISAGKNYYRPQKYLNE